MVDSKEPTEIVSARLGKSKVAALAKLAEQNGREIGEQIEFLVTEALIEGGFLSPEQAALHRLRESLVRRFLDAAVTIIAQEGHRNDITIETGRRIILVPKWKADYETYLKSRDKATINPTLGRRVKLRLGLITGKSKPVVGVSIFSTFSELLAPSTDLKAA